MKKGCVCLNELNLKGIYVEINLNYLKKLFFLAGGKKPHYDFLLAKKLGAPINKRFKKCISIYNWFSGTRKIPLDKLIILSNISKIPWKGVEREIISLNSGQKRAGRVYINWPLTINFKLGSIVGHLLGDGSIDSKYQQVFFSNSDKTLLLEFKNYMYSIFGIRPRIWMQKRASYGNTKWEKRLDSINNLKKGRNCGLFYPSICGKILNAIFGNFALGFDKKFTLEILNSNLDFKKGLIRAFYDDESAVGIKNIRLFQDKLDILKSFRDILISINIIPSEIKTYTKRNKLRFYFDIFRKSNFFRFEKEIGFTSPKKLNKLKSLCKIKKLGNAK